MRRTERAYLADHVARLWKLALWFDGIAGNPRFVELSADNPYRTAYEQAVATYQNHRA